MSIEQALVAKLRAATALTDLVGERIEPVINQQDTALPALSYQLISRAAEIAYDGAETATLRYQLTAIGASYASVLDVLAACKATLGGVSWGGGIASFVENEFDGYSQSGTQGIYVRRMDVLIFDP